MPPSEAALWNGELAQWNPREFEYLLPKEASWEKMTEECRSASLLAVQAGSEVCHGKLISKYVRVLVPLSAQEDDEEEGEIEEEKDSERPHREAKLPPPPPQLPSSPVRKRSATDATMSPARRRSERDATKARKFADLMRKRKSDRE